MSELKNKILSDLQTAIKSQDKNRMSVLKMLKTDITNEEIKNNREELSDEQVMSVIQHAAKQRRESIEEYRKAGKEERASAEESELKILTEYLPEQLSETEITQIIEKAIADIGAVSIRDMGKVMGKVMPLVKGKADGKLVNSIVKNKLNQ